MAELFWPSRARLAVSGLLVVVSAGLTVESLLLSKPVFDQARCCPDPELLAWLVAAMTGLTALGEGVPPSDYETPG
ncbi:MAG: hypothetical protein ACRDSR_23035 [Pseudonocardiaceae bacterium]